MPSGCPVIQLPRPMEAWHPSFSSSSHLHTVNFGSSDSSVGMICPDWAYHTHGRIGRAILDRGFLTRMAMAYLRRRNSSDHHT
jgi:hypothetical protein